MDTMIVLVLLAPVLTGGTQTSRYITERDYLSVTSENYPKSYPGPDSWLWQWTVESGLWAVVFVDFELACGHSDRLLISDPRRNLTFTCGNPPSKHYPYVIESPEFSLQLVSNSQGDQPARGFKCQVLYGTSRGALQSKIDDMDTRGNSNVPDPDEDSGALNTQTVVILLLLVIIPLVVIIVIGAVILLRRRQMQQSTNTSVHLNIGAIRRDSAVSYTRNGNGPPGGARPRLDSESSLPPDTSASRPKRPVKRSESNASWAMRAEMNTTFRNGSCSSEGHHADRMAPNLYGPCPGESGLGKVGHEDVTDMHKGVGCRLSTICEESSSITKLSASFPVPVQSEQPSLAIANAGYMLMTRCSSDYANCSPN